MMLVFEKRLVPNGMGLIYPGQAQLEQSNQQSSCRFSFGTMCISSVLFPPFFFFLFLFPLNVL